MYQIRRNDDSFCSLASIWLAGFIFNFSFEPAIKNQLWTDCELSCWAEKGQFCWIRSRIFLMQLRDVLPENYVQLFNIFIFKFSLELAKIVILNWNSVKPLSFEVSFSIEKFWQVMLHNINVYWIWKLNVLSFWRHQLL